jgi:hypothetical protein
VALDERPVQLHASEQRTTDGSGKHRPTRLQSHIDATALPEPRLELEERVAFFVLLAARLGGKDGILYAMVLNARSIYILHILLLEP